MRLSLAALPLTVCLALGLAAANVQAGLQITEVYFGISGPDGTEDFVEISNLGNSTVSLGGLFYDDASLDITAGGDLPNIDLAPGESAVILVNVGEDPSDGPDAIAEFQSVFGIIPNLFTVPDGGLSGGGDTAAILDGNGDVIDSFTYEEDDINQLLFTPDGNGGFTVFTATYENLSGTNNAPGSIIQSTVGVNGAFASNTFQTDSPIFGGTEDDDQTPADETVFVDIFIVGSPGFVPASAVIPEPAGIALAGLALAGLITRRRS